jgi:hypothetical protein
LRQIPKATAADFGKPFHWLSEFARREKSADAENAA